MVKEIFNEFKQMRGHHFNMLIFFVTGICNSRCLHCFYSKNLGPNNKGMALEEISKLSQSMPPFRTLLLSGGEPTLRPDLPQLVKIFRSNNNIQNISIPTNGLLSDRIARIAKEIAEVDSGLEVSFNVSIDGEAATHDHLRGVPGGFNAALRTVSDLHKLTKKYKNFRVLVNSVICNQNYKEIVGLAQEIQKTGWVNAHFFEIIRGESPDKAIKFIPPAELSKIYRALIPIQKEYIWREADRQPNGLWRIWRKISDLGYLKTRYYYQCNIYGNYLKYWDFPCMAGESIGVIDHNGWVTVCELNPKGVNLSDYDYNFSKAWSSAVIRKEAALAKSHRCDCTHSCFLNVSFQQNFKARFFYGPLAFVKQHLNSK